MFWILWSMYQKCKNIATPSPNHADTLMQRHEGIKRISNFSTCSIFKAFLMSPLLRHLSASRPLSGTSSLIQENFVKCTAALSLMHCMSQKPIIHSQFPSNFRVQSKKKKTWRESSSHKQARVLVSSVNIKHLPYHSLTPKIRADDSKRQPQFLPSHKQAFKFFICFHFKVQV
jgi:hypothetical protein